MDWRPRLDAACEWHGSASHVAGSRGLRTERSLGRAPSAASAGHLEEASPHVSGGPRVHVFGRGSGSVPASGWQPRDPTAWPGADPRPGGRPGAAVQPELRELLFLLIFYEGIGFVIKTAKLFQVLWQISQSTLRAICFDDFVAPPQATWRDSEVSSFC